jgi:hypothetical protein
VIGAFLIFLVSVPGLWSGLRGLASAQTPGQKAAVAGDILYGTVGPIIALLIGPRKFSSVTILAGWAILVTATAAIAPAAWGSERAESGVLAGLSAAMVVTAIIWLTTRGLAAGKS